MLWRAEPIFAGRCVVVAAGGPSFSLSQVREIGIARAKDLIRVIAINDAVYPCWFADINYACDHQWWETHNGVPGFAGLKVGLRHHPVPVYPGIRVLNSTGPEGIEDDPGGLRTAGNSGYQVLNLCAHLGAAKILLCGYDMRGDNSAHWFGRHPESCRKQMTGGFDRMAKHYNGIAGPLADRGIEVINCTPGSAITAFPQGDLMTELKRVEEAVKKPHRKPTDAKAAVYTHRQALAGANGYKTR